MKVCFLTTSFPAFEEDIQSPFILRLAKAIVKEDIKVTVVCPFYQKSLKKEESYEGVKIKRFQYMFRKIQTITEGEGVSSFMKSFWGLVQGVTFLTAMFYRGFKETKDADLIHCQWALSGLPAYFISRLRRIPYIITLRGEDVTLAKKKLFRSVQKFLFKRAGYLASNNQALLDEVSYPGLKTPMEMITNGVSLETFGAGNGPAMRKKFNISSDEKVVLFIGWMIKRKGVDYLLKGWSKLKGEKRKLLLVGEGPDQDEFEKLAEDLGIKEQVIFAGKSLPTEIPSVLAAADIFILPSLAEGMPNVVMEAMAAGKPVVATRVQGTPQLMGDMGILIDSKNSEQITKALQELIDNPEKCSSFAKGGKQRIINLGLTWKNSAENYEEIYKKVLGK